MSRLKSIAHKMYLALLRKVTGPMEHRLNQRADKYERVVDARIEERIGAVINYRAEIIDRTDAMLQIFEQRLDKQRREIKALRESLTDRNEAPNNGTRSKGGPNFDAQPAHGAPDVSAPNGGQSPSDQIISFRRLAEKAGWPTKQKLLSSGQSGATLYERIIDWKKQAQDGLNN